LFRVAWRPFLAGLLRLMKNARPQPLMRIELLRSLISRWQTNDKIAGDFVGRFLSSGEISRVTWKSDDLFQLTDSVGRSRNVSIFDDKYRRIFAFVFVDCKI